MKIKRKGIATLFLSGIVTLGLVLLVFGAAVAEDDYYVEDAGAGVVQGQSDFGVPNHIPGDIENLDAGEIRDLPDPLPNIAWPKANDPGINQQVPKVPIVPANVLGGPKVKLLNQPAGAPVARKKANRAKVNVTPQKLAQMRARIRRVLIDLNKWKAPIAVKRRHIQWILQNARIIVSQPLRRDDLKNALITVRGQYSRSRIGTPGKDLHDLAVKAITALRTDLPYTTSGPISTARP